MYDRTRPLVEGEVRPSGVNLTCITLPPIEIFWRMLKFSEFDVAEMSLALYPIMRLKKLPFIAIPVFPFRAFYHLGVLCNTKSGIKQPKDLSGKKFGVPDFQMTAAVWTRGILKDEFGVRTEKIHWVEGRPAEANLAPTLGIKPSPKINVSKAPQGSDLNSMLTSGAIDAMLSAPQSNLATYLDSSHGKGISGPQVRRLFGHPMDEAKRFFAKSGFVPFSHTIAIREEVVKEHPWVPLSLLRAFEDSKRLSLLRINRLIQSNIIEARLVIEEQQKAFGDDPCPYGFERNKAGLDLLLRYLKEQGLVRGRFNWKEHFFESTLV